MKKKALIFGSILALAVMVFGIASTGAWWTTADDLTGEYSRYR